MVLPTTKDDSDPFVGQGADGGMMALSKISLHGVVGSSPLALFD
jgi:hypothetical protein